MHKLEGFVNGVLTGALIIAGLVLIIRPVPVPSACFGLMVWIIAAYTITREARRK